jgi:hypothetical protein
VVRAVTVLQTKDGPSFEGASADSLRELLGELESLLRSQGVRVDEDLAPGLARDDVRHRFDAARLPVPDEAVEWFAWRNGQTAAAMAQKRESAIPVFSFWSLDEVLAARRTLEGSRLFGSEEWQWSPDWLHLIGDNNGVAMSMAAGRSRAPLIRGLEISDPNTAPDFTERQVVSLCTPVSWWIEDLRSGVIGWNAREGIWDMRLNELPLWRRRMGLG